MSKFFVIPRLRIRDGRGVGPGWVGRWTHPEDPNVGVSFSARSLDGYTLESAQEEFDLLIEEEERKFRDRPDQRAKRATEEFWKEWYSGQPNKLASDER